MSSTTFCAHRRPLTRTEQVTRKLVTHTPPSELVDAYLGEIAKGYGVAWVPPIESKDDGGDGGDGGLKANTLIPT